MADLVVEALGKQGALASMLTLNKAFHEAILPWNPKSATREWQAFLHTLGRFQPVATG